MGKVDYSKWDNLEDLSDKEDIPHASIPQITKFEDPVSINLGPKDPVSEKLGPEGLAPQSLPPNFDYLDESRIAEFRKPFESHKISNSLPEATKKKESRETPWGKWDQNKNEISAWILVPSDFRGADLNFVLKSQKLALGRKGEKAFFEKTFYSKVVEEEEAVIWEIVNLDGKRYVHISLAKDMSGFGPEVVQWWRKLFKEDEKEEDFDNEDRQRHQNNSEKFRENWKIAHEMFKEKVKNTKPQEIEVKESIP